MWYYSTSSEGSTLRASASFRRVVGLGSALLRSMRDRAATVSPAFSANSSYRAGVLASHGPGPSLPYEGPISPTAPNPSRFPFCGICKARCGRYSGAIVEPGALFPPPG